MLRTLLACSMLVMLAGCISFSSSTESTAAPDYKGFCQDKEAQCRGTCGDAGVQTFTCKAGPGEGVDYRCECKKPAGQKI